VRRYLQKLSGPLLDRIDLKLRIENPTRVEIANTEPRESSGAMRTRVEAGRATAHERFSGLNFSLNSGIPSEMLRSRFRANQKAMSALHILIERDEITARGFHKILRLAWTIADLRGVTVPGLDEVEEALRLRTESYQ
jgi:magnesium chelatase family protein